MIITNTEQQVEKFKELLSSEKYFAYIHEQDRRGQGYIEIDFTDILEHEWELADILLDNAENTIEAMKASLKELDLKNDDLQILLKKVPDSANRSVRELRVEDIGKLIKIEGSMRDKTKIYGRAKQITYNCPQCGNVVTIPQFEEKRVEPTKCGGCNKTKGFKVIDKSMVNFQRVLLEELAENMAGNGQPSTLKVYLEGALVSVYNEPRFNPGSRVRLTGYLREKPIRLKNQNNAESVEYDYEFIALNIENIDEKKIDINVTQEDQEQIKQISQREDCVQYLAKCAFPHIFGYDEVKVALLCLIAGGVKKRINGMHMRGDIHIFLVGDPGTAKSKMLGTVNSIVPHARRSSGEQSSGVGLTATVEKNEYLGGFTLRAGTLALANGSIAVIDELDKMKSDDRAHMHGALEDQEIPISKGGIQATLRSQCSCLAAANPKFGRYSPKTPIIEQIEVPPTLLNRFDMIFPILDTPDTKDKELFHHVVGLHMQENSDTIESEIGEDLLRKYLFQARELKPYLSEEARATIVNYVWGVRDKVNKKYDGSSKVPINARQCNGLVRIAEAFAKLRMSNVVRYEDANEAVKIMQHYMNQIAFDNETGMFDYDQLQTGISGSDRNVMNKLIGLIKELEEDIGKVIPIEKVAEKANEKGIEESRTDETLEKLKTKGDIFYPKSGYLSRT